MELNIKALPNILDLNPNKADLGYLKENSGEIKHQNW